VWILCLDFGQILRHLWEFIIMKHKILDPRPETFGWTTTCQVKRKTYRLTLNKTFAVGAYLRKGLELYCYQQRDGRGRPVIMIYLDGQARKLEKEQDYVEANGWVSAVEVVRGTFRLRIKKTVAEGARLEKGQILYCHRRRDVNRRPVLIVCLDEIPIGKIKTKRPL